MSDQINNCSVIWDRYHPELLTGSVDPETAVKTMYEEMEAEGLSEIIAEAQRQIDAFLERKLRGRVPDQREKKRLCDALLRRGFSWPEVKAGLNRLGSEIED